MRAGAVSFVLVTNSLHDTYLPTFERDRNRGTIRIAPLATEVQPRMEHDKQCILVIIGADH